MPLEGSLSVGSLNLLLIIALFDSQNLVVVLLLSFLLLLLGILQLLTNTETGRVDARRSSEIVDSLIPKFKILVDFTTLHESLRVIRHHF